MSKLKRKNNTMRKTVFYSKTCYTVMYNYFHLCSITWKIFIVEFNTCRMGARQYKNIEII